MIMSSVFQKIGLDSADASSICGSISIACWLVVFVPQLLENIRRRSTDGLSVRFVSIWLSGDICNVIGSILQGVLPTMIILAFYYASVDILLLGQIFYFRRGFTWSEEISNSQSNGLNESRCLLTTNSASTTPRELGVSTHMTAAHLSPAVPFIVTKKPLNSPRSILNRIFINLLAVVSIILVGIFGWFLTRSTKPESTPSPIVFNPLGQTFGYFCATLYLSSRMPQLLLNYRRKSTEGISVLFFLFACIGNLTYVLSILIYEPHCESQSSRGQCNHDDILRNYWRHIAVNASWLIGSAGTCLLDFCIFTQFWLYRIPEL